MIKKLNITSTYERRLKEKLNPYGGDKRVPENIRILQALYNLSSDIGMSLDVATALPDEGGMKEEVIRLLERAKLLSDKWTYDWRDKHV